MNMEPATQSQASSKDSANQITYWSCRQGSMASTTELVLDADGCAVCPECKVHIHCGNVGLSNLTIRHMGSKICRETKAKHDKDNKKKNSSILTFFQRPEATPVPSKTMPTTIISNRQPTSGASVTSSPPRMHKRPLSGQPVSKLVTKFQYLINNLPKSVPEGSVDDPLAIFEEDPKKFDDLSLNAEELWEAKLNGLLKSVLGWGVDQRMDGIIR